ncbi:MAG TPA: enoyl-CoA hydratase-related protein [Dehalococcoidia bacterium]|nr:enoyl-CoA hydratase-related protein [Dehalococcoidia bacterium]
MVLNYSKEGKIATLTLNRPEALNALNVELISEISKALIDFMRDDSLWVGIITGAGEKAFCAGADIKEALPKLKEFRNMPWAEPPLFRGLKLWKPLVAAVNGHALGGGLEVALLCDVRIASENATFGVPEVTLGLIPAWGATQRLPRAIPTALAAEMLMTGRLINAQEAYRIGLVNKLVPQAELMNTARQMADMLCKPSPLAVRAVKKAMYDGLNLSLPQGMEVEKEMTDYIVSTEDFAEGTTAFIEKRKPQWKVK